MARNLDSRAQGLDQLRATVAANPRSTAFVVLAHSLCEAGYGDEAEEVCRRGLASAPRHVPGQVALGRALLERGRLREAQETLIEAVKAQPDNGEGFLWLGQVVLRRGDRDRARTILTHAEQLLPDDGRVAQALRSAGGVPLASSPRPESDFEHTRITDVETLAEQLRAQEHVRGSGESASPQIPVPALEALDDPTSVNTTAALQAWLASGPSTPMPAPPLPLRPPSPAPRIVAVPHPGIDRPPAGPRDRSPGKTPSARSHGVQIFVGLVLLVFLAVGVFAIVLPGGTVSRPAPRPPLVLEFVSPSLDALARVRDAAQRAPTLGGTNEAENMSQVGFIGALLAMDYGQASDGEKAEAAFVRAETTASPPEGAAARISAGRALLALAHGDLTKAARLAEMAQNRSPRSTEALLVVARVRVLQGDLEAARDRLAHLLESTPGYAPAVLDWGNLWIWLGDPQTAAGSLAPLAQRAGESALVLLALQEAERSVGATRTGDLPPLCEREGRKAAVVRAACQLGLASEARMAGNRLLALKLAHAALTDAGQDPRLLAAAALLLALTGDPEGGAKANEEARRRSSGAYPGVVWADVAVRLARRQKVNLDVPALQLAPTAGSRVVRARAILANAGPAALLAELKHLGAGLVAADADLRALQETKPRPKGAPPPHPFHTAY